MRANRRVRFLALVAHPSCSAHAVASIDREIEFSHIEIRTPEQWAQGHPDGAAAGGLHLAPPPSSWVLPDPVNALEMALAGSLAEEVVYGHYLKEGYVGDLRIWRMGAGRPDAQTQDSIESVLGCRFADVVSTTRSWLAEAFPSIRLVASALAEVDSSASVSLIDYDDGPWSLTRRDPSPHLYLVVAQVCDPIRPTQDFPDSRTRVASVMMWR